MLYKVIYEKKHSNKTRTIYCFGLRGVEKTIQESCSDSDFIFKSIILLDFSFSDLKKCIKKVVEEKDA